MCSGAHQSGGFNIRCAFDDYDITTHSCKPDAVSTLGSYNKQTCIDEATAYGCELAHLYQPNYCVCQRLGRNPRGGSYTSIQEQTNEEIRYERGAETCRTTNAAHSSDLLPSPMCHPACSEGTCADFWLHVESRNQPDLCISCLGCTDGNSFSSTDSKCSPHDAYFQDYCQVEICDNPAVNENGLAAIACQSAYTYDCSANSPTNLCRPVSTGESLKTVAVTFTVTDVSCPHISKVWELARMYVANADDTYQGVSSPSTTPGITANYPCHKTTIGICGRQLSCGFATAFA